MSTSSSTDTRHLEDLARLVRYQSLAMTTAAGSGHPSSSLSAADLMTVLWFDGWFRVHADQPDHPNNDRLIFSKGHASPLYYALWYAAGRLTDEDLRGYRRFGSPLEGHPTAAFPHVDAATGSLGQGLAIGAGFALNARLEHLPYRTFVLLGDSEMSEGSQWEAVQLAAHYRLGNLIGVLDVNRLGQRGPTMLGWDVDTYARRFEAFGWRTLMVDGHAIPEIRAAYARIDETPEVPTMIIARTKKGRGVKLLEDQPGWHGRALDEDEFAAAVSELEPVPLDLRGRLAAPEDRRPARPAPRQAKPPHYEPDARIATRKAYGRALERLYPQFTDIVALDAEVSNSTGAEQFKRAHPDRFFEMFIAEQAMVGIATGLARSGRIPFVSTFAAFLTRAFDQIRMTPHSAANVKFVGSHAGVSIGEDGPSQMGLEDIAMFRSVPGCVVLHPADAVATEKLVEAAARHNGLVYLRTMRQSTPRLYPADEEFLIGGSKLLRSSDDDVAVIVAAGATVFEALTARDRLAEAGQPVAVVDAYSIAPIDQVRLTELAARTRLILTVEDHYAAGGLGEAVKSALSPLPVPVFSLSVSRKPCSGRPDELREFAGISADAIVRCLHQALGLTPEASVAPAARRAAAAHSRSTSTSPATMNPLRQLSDLGQSVWLDFLSRGLITGGTLRRLIHEDGLSGVTSNPAIFDEAISSGSDYDESIRAAAVELDDRERIFERIAVEDIRSAADELRPVYDATEGRDGFVSLEASPLLAHDTEASIQQARELWRAVARPNVFIKIPGTTAGLPAIRRLLAEGININVTLLFSLERYRDVIEAFLAGMEERGRHGEPVRSVASVASFFLSRIDAKVDRRLDDLAAQGGARAGAARRLRGQVAIANARRAHEIHREVFAGGRFQPLREAGVRPQRLLWASTSTKDPSYPDTKYIEPLIGRDTISTMPLKTLDAYRDHGQPALRLTDDPAGARRTLDELAELGVGLPDITRELEEEGIEKFVQPYQRLLEHLESKLEQVTH